MSQSPISSGSTGRPLAAWKSRPLFVSSTFADMHAERDFLRVHAFSILEERLRERCHYLETIDLRQGVETASEADLARRELKVLKVCLEEIERSRPFFVGIIGDRYGWVPPKDRMEAAAGEAGFRSDVAGRSVTELEILYGVLDNPDQRTRSWFYIRELDYDGMPEELRAKFDDRFAGDQGAPERVARLRTLKERLKRELPDRVRVYRARWDPDQAQGGAVTDLAGLAEMVVQDLWSDMAPETEAWLRKAPTAWQEADRQALEDFVVTCTRGFVERPAVTAPLLEYALSPPTKAAEWGVCLTGESGSGKSTIFAGIYKSLSERDDVLVLANAAGIYPRSGSVDAMLRRWVRELSAFLAIADPLEEPREEKKPDINPGAATVPPTYRAPAEETEETFGSLLSRATQKVRVVLLVDALNQFERSTRAKYLTWLPKHWPENARLLATAIPGIESEALEQRPGVVGFSLPPIDAEEAFQIAHRYYRQRYHRAPNAVALKVLLAKKSPDGRLACGNPLWLELTLQEMNLLQADDYARAEREFSRLPGSERIQALQVREAERLPADAAGIYGELLRRAEGDFGEVWTRSLLNLIALGRAGWRESDLVHMMETMSGKPWDALAFAGVRRALGPHLVQRGHHAQWDVFHDQLRECVLTRNLPREPDRRSVHGVISDYLLSLQEGDPLRVSEAMVHLIGSGDQTRAARYFASLEHGNADLTASATVLAQHAASSEEGLEFATGLPAAGELTDLEIIRVASNLQFEGVEAFKREMGLGPRLHLLEACLLALKSLLKRVPLDPAWLRELSVSHNKVGEVLLAQGKLGEALKAYREHMLIAERLAGSDPSKKVWQRDLGVSHAKIGEVLQAQGRLGEALEAYRESMSIAKRLARSDPSDKLWQSDLGVSHIKVGEVLQEQGKLGEALEAYRESLSIAEGLARSDPPNMGWQHDLAVSYGKIGEVLQEQGKLGEALETYRELMSVAEGLARTDPSDALWRRDLAVSHDRVGSVLKAQGNLGEALKAFREYMRLVDSLAQSDPSNALWRRDCGLSRGRIGGALQAQGRLDEALEAYRESVSIAESLARSDPTNALWRRDIEVGLNKVGDVLLLQGKRGEALEAYQKFMSIAEALARSDPSNAVWQHDLAVSQGKIGEALQAQGSFDEALEAYREYLSIVERLARSDPSNSVWQQDLGMGNSKVGDVILAQGNLEEALRAYRESLVIRKRLVRSDPSNAGSRRDLGVSHNMVGDVLLAQGKPAGALKAYKDSLLIRERLAVSDPSNALWQRDLVASYSRLAVLARQTGDTAAEREHWQRCRELLVGMRESGMYLDPPIRDMLMELEGTD